MATAAANQISNELNSPYVSAALVDVVILLSSSTRKSIRAFLTSQLVSLRTARLKATTQISKGDILAQKLQAMSGAITIILQPVDRFFRNIPIDQALKDEPLFADILDSIASTVPLEIPSNISTNILGIAGFELLEGVESYGDLRDKLDEIVFRSARAVSFKEAANASLRSIDAKLEQVQDFIDLLTLMDTYGFSS